MLKYLTYFKLSFKDLSAYRADFIIYIIANMVFFFIFFALWKNIYTNSGAIELNSYTLANMVTYYFVTSLIYRLDPTYAMYMNNMIWNGNITNDLIKPWGAVLVDMLFTLAELSLRFLLYLPFCFFILVVAFQYIDIPSVINLVYFFITVILGIFLAMSFYYILHGLCFHFGDQDANISLISYIVAFLAGGLFPLAFLPASLKTFFYVLPFRFLFDTPANIFLGKLSFPEILTAWGQMIIWTIVFFLIFYCIFKSGLKKYAGTGR